MHNMEVVDDMLPALIQKHVSYLDEKSIMDNNLAPASWPLLSSYPVDNDIPLVTSNLRKVESKP